MKELATLAIIADIGKDVHAYRTVTGADVDPKKVQIWWLRPRAPYIHKAGGGATSVDLCARQSMSTIIFGK